VPSLKGVWYRGHYLHDGSVASLEEMFDPDPLKEPNVPGGWTPVGAKTHAIQGHEFGLKLKPEETGTRERNAQHLGSGHATDQTGSVTRALGTSSVGVTASDNPDAMSTRAGHARLRGLARSPSQNNAQRSIPSAVSC